MKCENDSNSLSVIKFKEIWFNVVWVSSSGCNGIIKKSVLTILKKYFGNLL